MGRARASAVVRATLARLRPRRAPSRVLAVVALVLVASATVHLGVHLVDDRDWWATDAWRKAATFPFAFGLTSLATGWALDRLPARRLLAWTVVLGTAGPAVVESAAVTLQAWRGVPSHFNEATGLDALVWAVMGQAIAVQAVTTLVLFLWAAWALRREDRAVVVAVVGGLALLLLGAGATGGAMVARGAAVVEATGVPGSTLVGGAGSLKVAHGVAIHGLELLLVALAVAEVRGLAARTRARLGAWLLVGLCLAFVGTGWQAASGHAVQSPTAAGAVAGIGAAVVLGASVALVRVRPPSSAGGTPGERSLRAAVGGPTST